MIVVVYLGGVLMKKSNKLTIIIIAAVVLVCLAAGSILNLILILGNMAGTSRARESFNFCPEVASERYVAFAGYKGEEGGDEKSGNSLICLYDVETGITDTIYEVAEEEYIVCDPILYEDAVEFKIENHDCNFWYTYRISTGELSCQELGDDHTWGYDVWNSLYAVVETPYYGPVTLSTEHGDYRYLCTVGDKTFEIDAINSSMNWQASIYTQDCIYEDGKIYAKVLYHDDPFSKREGYYADHNLADRAAIDEYIVAIDLQQQTSERVFGASTMGKRIVGYRQGMVYYFKGSSIYARSLDSGKKKRIYTVIRPDQIAFAWCKNDLIILRNNNTYFGSYEVDKVIRIPD